MCLALSCMVMACQKQIQIDPVISANAVEETYKPKDEKGKPFKSLQDMEEQLGLVAVVLPAGYVPSLLGIVEYDTVVLLKQSIMGKIL